jgi:hypothetical protein
MGFRVLNNVHESRHAHIFTAKLFDSLSRMIVYNWWQAWAFINKKKNKFTKNNTLNELRVYGSEQILGMISA